MKRQKHYTSEKQILDKIDVCKAEVHRLNMLSADLERNSIRLLKEYSDRCSDLDWCDMTEGDRNLRAVGIESKQNSLKARKRAQRIEDVVLPGLGAALAEFKTLPMLPIVGDNCSAACRVGPSKEWFMESRNIGKSDYDSRKRA